jgi:hypothetical protein
MRSGHSSVEIDFNHAQCTTNAMSNPSNSDTPLTATFKIKLNGETIPITTISQAYNFITNLSSIEWIEFKSLHDDALTALESAAGNAMLRVQATNTLRTLFIRARLL